ncbi:MAG: M67 family metallopeptidase [Bacillota bacterium]
MFGWFGKKRNVRELDAHGRRRLFIPDNIYRRMINHCSEERPLEACGLLVGEAGHVTAGYATDNQHRSPVIYKVDDLQLLEVDREIRNERQEIIAIYHSHVKTDPVPSRTDIDQATWPEAFYVIVSLKERRPKVRAWRIVDRQVTEHPIVVVKHTDGLWRDLRKAVRQASESSVRNDVP